jgi:hypothetical protein
MAASAVSTSIPNEIEIMLLLETGLRNIFTLLKDSFQASGNRE